MKLLDSIRKAASFVFKFWMLVFAYAFISTNYGSIFNLNFGIMALCLFAMTAYGFHAGLLHDRKIKLWERKKTNAPQ